MATLKMVDAFSLEGVERVPLSSIPNGGLFAGLKENGDEKAVLMHHADGDQWGPVNAICVGGELGTSRVAWEVGTVGWVQVEAMVIPVLKGEFLDAASRHVVLSKASLPVSASQMLGLACCEWW